MKNRILVTAMAVIILILTISGICSGGQWKHIFYEEISSNPAPITYIQPRVFYQFNNDLTHFPITDKPYIVIDRYGNKKEYTKFNTDMDVERGAEQFISARIYKGAFTVDSFVIAYKGHEHFMFIKNAGTYPEFTRFATLKDLHPQTIDSLFAGAVNYNHLDGMAVSNSVSVGPVYLFYIIVACHQIYRESIDLDGTHYKEYPLPFVPNPVYPEYNDQTAYNLKMSVHNKLWMQLGIPFHTFCSFDINTEEWKLYDSTNLPIPLARIDSPTGDGTEKHTILSFFLDAEHKGPIIVTKCEKQKFGESEKEYSHFLLIWNNASQLFDSVSIKPKESEFWIEGTSAISEAFFLEKQNKIAMTFSMYPSTPPSESIKKNIRSRNGIILYDLSTKTCEILIPPMEYVGQSENEYEVSYPIYMGDYVDKDGHLGVGVLYYRGHFLQYDPTTSIEDVEKGIYQEIGFRNVYPNPITHHTVTADIMCYVQDISKVELGLYNLMGQKLIDLTNKFEYSEPTHTINVTFTMPDELPKGVYYLNVRKGTETRTKAIVIGE
jgi:hypothetical protein